MEFQQIGVSFTRQLQLVQEDNTIEVIQQSCQGEALGLKEWKTILQIAKKKERKIKKIIIRRGIVSSGTRRGKRRQFGNDIKKLLHKNDIIECLSMEHMHLGDNGTKAVSLGLARMRHLCNLTVLKLCNACVGDKGAILLKQGLCHGRCQLRELSLAGNNIGDTGAISVASLLDNYCDDNPALLILDLRSNLFQVSGAEGIATELRKNKTLVELNLNGNNLGDGGACAISEVIASHQKLQSLHLNGCKMNKAGMMSIANALRCNTALWRLDIRNNETTHVSEIGTLLLDVLRQNHTLIRLAFQPFDFPNIPNASHLELETKLQYNGRGVPFVHIELGKLPPTMFSIALVGIAKRWGVSTLFEVVKGQVGTFLDHSQIS